MQVKDLDACGQVVQPWWHKRRLACPQPLCATSSFTQQSEAIPARARLTMRLRTALAREIASGNRAVDEVAAPRVPTRFDPWRGWEHKRRHLRTCPRSPPETCAITPPRCLTGCAVARSVSGPGAASPSRSYAVPLAVDVNPSPAMSSSPA